MFGYLVAASELLEEEQQQRYKECYCGLCRSLDRCFGSAAHLMNIRTAERRDLSAMLDIYNYEVKNGTATFDVEPRAGAAGEAWFAAHNTGNHPLLVAEEDGKVLGYASLSPYRDFDAYLQTVELSVYVAPESRGRGIASALMEAVLRLAREDADTHTVVSVIAGGNAASVRLHEKFGFTYSGTLHEVGLKFGRYLDIVNYELRVG